MSNNTEVCMTSDEIKNLDPPTMRRILTIALPMVISQATDTVMLFADRLFLSKLGKTYIAASMSGGLTNLVLMSLFLGIIGYVNAMVAQFYGGDKKEKCASTVAQGVYLSFLSYPVLLLVLPLVMQFFKAAGHTPHQIGLEYSYLKILLLGSILGFLRTALNSFFIGLGKTRIVMSANILAMVINVPLNYIFIFGKFGIPAMGIEGAAWGTVGGSFAAMIMITAFYFGKRYRDEFGTHTNWRVNRELSLKLARYGIPAGLEFFINIAAFNIFLQLIHSYSEDVAAAVTITFNWDLVSFIPMIGVGVATTTLVGQYVGAGDFDGARKAARLSYRIALAYASFMVFLFVTQSHALVSVFTSGFTDVDGKVMNLSIVMLRLAAIYLLADATNLVFSGALRGAGDTRWVMVISGVLHWIMASGVYVLVKVVHASPIKTWLFFIGFILTLGTCMVLRYRFGNWERFRIVEDERPGGEEGL